MELASVVCSIYCCAEMELKQLSFLVGINISCRERCDTTVRLEDISKKSLIERVGNQQHGPAVVGREQKPVADRQFGGN
jgi:hypothetical protein